MQKKWELCRGGDARWGVQSWTDPAEERGPQSGPAGRAGGENQAGVRSCPGQMPEESRAGSAWQHGKPLPAQGKSLLDTRTPSIDTVPLSSVKAAVTWWGGGGHEKAKWPIAARVKEPVTKTWVCGKESPVPTGVAQELAGAVGREP